MSAGWAAALMCAWKPRSALTACGEPALPQGHTEPLERSLADFPPKAGWSLTADVLMTHNELHQTHLWTTMRTITAVTPPPRALGALLAPLLPCVSEHSSEQSCSGGSGGHSAEPWPQPADSPGPVAPNGLSALLPKAVGWAWVFPNNPAQIQLFFATGLGLQRGKVKN